MRALRPAAHWILPLALIAASVVVALPGDPAFELLRYQRSAVEDGELWRLLTAHVVHLGPEHLGMNVAGLVLVWLLVGRRYSANGWLLVLLAGVMTTGAGFWFLDPDLRWYVGLSGLLHGLLLAGALGGLRSMPVESSILTIGLVAKLVYEQFAGPVPGSESLAGGAVIVNAHLYGMICGGITALLLLLHQRIQRSHTLP